MATYFKFYKSDVINDKALESFRQACKRASRIPWKNRAVLRDILTVDLRVPENWSRCHNGGDYYRYVRLIPTMAKGVFRLREDWSADWDIADYRIIDGDYVVLSKDDLFRLLNARREDE